VKAEGAVGDGAFVSGTEYWFLASRANNFLVASIVQLFYVDQVMSFPPIFMVSDYRFCVWWFGAWFMLEKVAFQAFVGGTSQYQCFVAHRANRNMILLLVVVVFQLLTEDQVMPLTAISFHLHLSLILLIFFQLLRE
jgi:hypothetical protein